MISLLRFDDELAESCVDCPLPIIYILLSGSIFPFMSSAHARPELCVCQQRSQTTDPAANDFHELFHELSLDYYNPNSDPNYDYYYIFAI